MQFKKTILRLLLILFPGLSEHVLPNYSIYHKAIKQNILLERLEIKGSE